MAKPTTIGPLGQDEKVRMLVYAHPGRGKTVLAAAADHIEELAVALAECRAMA